MKVVYASRNGHVEGIVRRVGVTDALKIEDGNERVDGDYLIFTYTDGNYEKETERSLSNVLAADEFIEHREGLRNSRIEGANNTDLHGTGGGSILDGLL